MPYRIRRATRDDAAELARHTFDMAVETENRTLDEAALSRGVLRTFDEPNLAEYYVAVVEPPPEAEDDESAEGNGVSPTCTSDGEQRSPGSPTDHRVTAHSPSPFPPTPSGTCKTSPIAGFVMTTRNYRVHTATTIQLLQTVYIAPQHRRQGLFRKLYEHVEAAVRADPQCEGIWLYVEEANVTAIEAYRRVGLQREDKYMMRWSKCGF